MVVRAWLPSLVENWRWHEGWIEGEEKEDWGEGGGHCLGKHERFVIARRKHAEVLRGGGIDSQGWGGGGERQGHGRCAISPSAQL